MALAFVIVLVCGSSLSAEPFFLPTSGGQYAEQVDNLFYIMLWIVGFFFVLVVGLLVFFIIRFRAKKPNEEGKNIHGHSVLEFVWTIIPFGIMVYLAIISTTLIDEQLNPPPKTLIVEVIGRQFGWDFNYYESEPNGTQADTKLVSAICGNPASFVRIRTLGVSSKEEITLPKGRPVRFLVSSKDVIHSFWIPEFRIKRDTVPGRVSDMWFTPDKVGTFTAHCAELCGLEHSTMNAKIKIVDSAEFDTWLSQKQKIANS